MSELEQLGREAREQLGSPSEEWLQQQRQRLRRATIAGHEQQRPGRHWLIAVAVVAVSVGIWLAAPHFGSSAATLTEIASGPDRERRIPLDDGSSLLLASQSRIRFNAGSAATRCIVDIGTVHFEVAPQRDREFLVVAGAFEVRVVGTRFSVARDAAGKVEIAVVEGIVRVQTPSRSAPLELRAGDHLRGAGRELELRGTASATSPAARTAPAPSVLPPPPVGDSPSPLEPSARTTASSRDDWLVLYRDRDYEGALRAARRVGVADLLENLPPQPMAELADVARFGGDSELALRVFDALARRFPSSHQAQDALFLSGRLLAVRGESATARARLETYLARNQRGTYAVEATGRLVELYAASGDTRAKAAAKAYLERAPDGPYQRLCRSVLAAP